SSDARGGELEVRKNLVDAGIVDVMITISPNFFYTVTLPVTLWFFDKAKTDPEHPRHDQTLFIDARKIFSQVHGSRTQREFSQSQLLNLAAIVWLYRGEGEKFSELRGLYVEARDTWQNSETANEETGKTYKGIDAHKTSLAAAFHSFAGNLSVWHKSLPAQIVKTNGLFDDASNGGGGGAAESEELANLFEDVAVLEPISESNGFSFRDAADWESFLTRLKAVDRNELADKAAINELFKRAEEAVLFAYKVLRPDKDKTFNRADIRGALKRLSDERSNALFVLERIAYFETQAAWLDANFPDGVWRDVEGLCKIASRADIQEQNFSLNPGRFVGVAMEDDGMDEAEFRRFMSDNADALASLHAEADELQRLIAEDLTALFTEAKAEAV
ncbi:MAG TPA: N-6 DNA methylase, partial [Pyrinomonadaceae bacterium]|nr:N-6 DNA methylase [Pyrinomonadaceae bacterium]